MTTDAWLDDVTRHDWARYHGITKGLSAPSFMSSRSATGSPSDRIIPHHSRRRLARPFCPAGLDRDVQR
jgi:hypothetical protein